MTKELPVQAGSLLAEQNWSGGRGLHHQSYQAQEWRGEDEKRQGDAQVQRAFGDAVRGRGRSQAVGPETWICDVEGVAQLSIQFRSHEAGP